MPKLANVTKFIRLKLGFFLSYDERKFIGKGFPLGKCRIERATRMKFGRISRAWAKIDDNVGDLRDSFTRNLTAKVPRSKPQTGSAA